MSLPTRCVCVASLPALLPLATLAGCAASQPAEPARPAAAARPGLQLGNFSVSLTVKDLAASKAFYEKLGFTTFSTFSPKSKYVIMQNGTATIGLFEGMFPKNTLTFNPGWDYSANTLPAFDDVRAIQRKLQADGLQLANKADESSTGPAFIMLMDPDGNPVLIDQHVPAPRK
jgi:predicted enzyme related to lactoylglutathione lyase